MTARRRVSINGRFLTQPKTGVQRYAYEIVRQIDAIVSNAPELTERLDIEIVAPAGVDPAAHRGAIPLRAAGRGKGYGWEQFELPRLAHGAILNLCNTAPVVRDHQIVCIHGANSFVYPQSYSRKFRYAQRVLFPAIGRRARTVTSVSQASASLLASLGIVAPETSIRVVPNGHEHVFGWKSEASTLDRGKYLGKPYVLVIGSRAPHKNVKLVHGFAAELAEAGIGVVVTGGAFDLFRSEAGAVSEAVDLLGYVSDDDLAFLLENALCLAFPSLVEGFGLPLVEAMALGCPVVSSNVTSMPEVCGDAAILLPPDKPELWLEAIRALAASTERRADLSARGRDRVKAFSWTRSARAYIDLMLEG